MKSYRKTIVLRIFLVITVAIAIIAYGVVTSNYINDSRLSNMETREALYTSNIWGLEATIGALQQQIADPTPTQPVH